MIKVGILTFHRAVNYGAVLQAYALQKTFLRQGAECKIIDFRCRAVEDYYRPFRIFRKGSFQVMAGQVGLAVLNYPGRKKKKAETDRFLKCYLKLSDPVEQDLSALNDQYDIFVTGSDQVFNSDLSGQDAGVYYLSFAKKPRYSYAASFGKAFVRESHREMTKAELGKFRSISVREESGVSIVSSLTGQKAEVHVDPTMLLDALEWSEIEKKPSECRKNYILVYNMLSSKFLYQTAEILGKIKNLEVIFVNNKIRKMRKDYSHFRYLDNCSPEEFLWLIHHADYVLSSSFHGTVFSLLFHKQFLVLLPESEPRNERLVSLLQMTGLPERLFTKDVSLEKMEEAVDWTSVEEKISFHRDRSVRYVSQILNDI